MSSLILPDDSAFISSDARLVTATGDAISDNTFRNLTTSLVDQVTLSFTMPTNWNTALIVARSTIEIDVSGSPTDNMEYRVEIGSDNGVTLVHVPFIANPNTHGASHSAVATGDVTIAVAARKVAGANVMDFVGGELSYIAMRAS